MQDGSDWEQSAQRLGVGPQQTVHWYDFVCPFCYVGQHRTEILTAAGLRVAELPFRAHPEIPEGGRHVGPRRGAMYEMLDREAREAGLPLHWPDRLPNTRNALASAEWVREQAPQAFAGFQKSIFAAHFARGEDIGDRAVLEAYAREAGVDVAAMDAALADGSAYRALEDSEHFANGVGLQGTPAWLIDGRLISGLRPAAEFVDIARSVREAAPTR